MLSVGWCHHQLFIMPFAAISLSNLLRRLNNLTFTFGMWRGRRALLLFVCGAGGNHTTVPPKHHDEGPVVTTAALPVWFLTLSAPADVSLASPHATPRHATLPPPTPPTLVSGDVREKGIRSLRANASSSSLFCKFTGERRNKKRHGSKKKRTEQKFDYKYI